jgi:hypothetical protein
MANPNKVGVVFGAVLGGIHLLWSLLVLAGVAQALVDFVFWAHMMHLSIAVGPFDAVAAVSLIVYTAVTGYILGYIGAWVWNRMHS